MAAKPFQITVEEFRLYHTIDRALYSLLVVELQRDPLESMQTLALWIWLERTRFNDIIRKILSLPQFSITELADEAITCLKCIEDNRFLLSTDADIMEKALKRGSEQTLTESKMAMVAPLAESFLIERIAQLGLGSDASPKRTKGHGVPCEERTMFVTFSKGYPVAEVEIREFFSRIFGDCIECIHMQEV